MRITKHRPPEPRAKKRGTLTSKVQTAIGNLSAQFGFFAPASYSHDGARTTRATAYWDTSAAGADETNLYDLPKLRERTRDLYRNNAIGRGAIRTMVTNVVGRGLKLQSTIDADYLGLTEDQADAWETEVERRWAMYARNCDAGRRMTFEDITRLVYLTKLQSGEAFVTQPIIALDDGFDLRLNIVEADMVENPLGTFDGPNMRDGIEVGRYDEPVAYHIKDKYGNYSRVPAFGERSSRRNVLHVYTAERPGQTRGLPFLSPVIETIKQLGDYKKSEQTASVVQSLFNVFIKSTRPEAIDDPYPNDKPSTTDDTDGDYDHPEHDYTLGPGAVHRLDEDEEIEMASPNRPNTAFADFVAAILREVAMALEIPYEILVKQFLASYSASRGAKVEFFKTVRRERTELINQFCQPTYEEWLYNEVLMGRISAPGFLSDPDVRAAYMKTHWIGETMGQIDEVKETMAASLRIQHGFSTYEHETAILTGQDFSQNARKLRKEREKIGHVAYPSSADLLAAMETQDDQ